MTETEGAAAPTNEQPEQAAGSEQANPNEGIRDVDAAPENAEQPKVDQEQPKPDETEQRRLSRNQRYQRKISALSGVVDQTRTENQSLKQQLEELKKASVTDNLPKPSDYPSGEFDPQYVADLAAIKAEAKISTKLDERDRKTAGERAATEAGRALEAFNVHAEKAKAAITDFDETIESFVEDGGEFAPHVVRRLHKAGEKGPVLAYQLAKDPDLTERLNAMSAEDAAVEIANLQAKATLPERKTQTKAPAPLSRLNGGAAATATVHDLAKSDDATAYVEARRKASA